jgi:hypothetical protein
VFAGAGALASALVSDGAPDGANVLGADESLAQKSASHLFDRRVRALPPSNPQMLVTRFTRETRQCGTQEYAGGAPCAFYSPNRRACLG